ncbi:MAG: site-2 protease family protein [Candidatus Pacebacteria bacterium]|nr:site-2 protease family protein [Candidatus Paceibacterota bacterium]
MFLTILVFFITLSTLIIFHELGHFLVAKKTGIKVEEFGLGYPPRAWGKKIGETTYSLNLIPFGGFVRLYGEDRAQTKQKERSFWAKSWRVRLAVILAGIVANVFLSWILFSANFLIVGVPVKTDKVIFEAVIADSPADKAGIEPGDVAVSFAGVPVTSIDGFIKQIEARKEVSTNLIILKEGVEKEIEITPRVETQEGEGPLGVIISSYELAHFPFWQMPFRAGAEGLKETWGWLVMIAGSLLKMIRELIFSGQVPQDVAGPIGILQVTSQVARSGVVAVFQFIGILSINLAIINTLPFPALDGGRFAFLVVELITGRRNHEKVEQWVNRMGMIFLLLLMLLVTINDIKRVLTTTEFGGRVLELWPF